MQDLSNRLKPSPWAKFIVAITIPQNEINQNVESVLEDEIGSLDTRSDIYCFSDFSNYYDSEFGGRCWKYFVSVSDLLVSEKLVPIKLRTEEIQKSFADKEGKRTVNLDPGYLNGWQLVLSTVKNHSHRIYLSDGVFGEVTLLFRRPDFFPLPWTYPDYQAEEQLRYFKKLRDLYNRQLKITGKPVENV